uniref:(northern house mosquito) hypothetical protein n=1 Tax=Culex pipiens TaxID=7175 RepID=A0A8D8E7P4_CULPI
MLKSSSAETTTGAAVGPKTGAQLGSCLPSGSPHPTAPDWPFIFFAPLLFVVVEGPEKGARFDTDLLPSESPLPSQTAPNWPTHVAFHCSTSTLNLRISSSRLPVLPFRETARTGLVLEMCFSSSSLAPW